MACRGSVSGDTEAQRSGNESSKRGGWITLPFILATLLGLSSTSFGWLVNMIVFLIEEFNIKSIAAAQISNVVNGCLNMLPFVTAILADSFFGNIPVILTSSLISLLGILLLTLISAFDCLRPGSCETGSILCQSPSKLQLGILYAAFTLLTAGSGGVRFTLASAGANQYKKPKEQGSFFNWYFLTLYAEAITGATAIVYTQDNASWKLGFAICTVTNLISFITFVSGKRFYKHDKPMGSPFTSLIRVIFAATSKRKAVITSNEEVYYRGIDKEGKTSSVVVSKGFRFFNRAALITEIGANQRHDSVSNNWKLCSVQEVEDFKAILRLFPLWLSIIFVTTPMVMQLSLIVLQALVTDRGLGAHFEVPAGSLQVIIIFTACIVILMNNWLVFPLYRKLTHSSLTPLQKVGISHVLTILSMVLSAVVEAKRLKTIEAKHPMTVLWLFPPLVVVGVGWAFQFPANNELFYGEFPESLKNTATSLTSLVTGISFYMSTGLIALIQKKTEWLPNNINQGRVDKVYWVLVIVGILNFGGFLLCSSFYRYRNLEKNDQSQDPEDVTT